jgi:hypothetical protein
LINVIYLSKQQAYIESRRAGIRYLCSKVKWQTQTLAPTGGAFTQTTYSETQSAGRSVIVMTGQEKEWVLLLFNGMGHYGMCEGVGNNVVG